MQHASPVLLHDPARSSGSWSPSSTWGVEATLKINRSTHPPRSHLSADKPWGTGCCAATLPEGQALKEALSHASNQQWAEGARLGFMHHSSPSPLPSSCSFWDKLLVVLFYPPWAPAVMAGYWAGWLCSLEGSPPCVHLSGTLQGITLPESWQQQSSGEVELAGKSLLGMDGEAGESFTPRSFCTSMVGWSAQKHTTTTGLLQECIYLH